MVVRRWEEAPFLRNIDLTPRKIKENIQVFTANIAIGINIAMMAISCSYIRQKVSVDRSWRLAILIDANGLDEPVNKTIYFYTLL